MKGIGTYLSFGSFSLISGSYLLLLVEHHADGRVQLEENVGPIVLINKFNAKPEEADQFLKAWAADAAYFKSQPGFISAQLHRSIGGSGTFINYAGWEFAAQLKKALNSINLQAILSDYPVSTVVSPHIFRNVAVPGICLD
jgi:quinol monooxygenase YgiN